MVIIVFPIAFVGILQTGSSCTVAVGLAVFDFTFIINGFAGKLGRSKVSFCCAKEVCTRRIRKKVSVFILSG
jgi:hypothetical protein